MHENAMERVLYTQESLPVFQNRMYESAEEARTCAHGSMRLVENQQTGLIYNSAFDASLLTYDQHYQNEQGLSDPFSRHLEDVSQILVRNMAGETLVEVGCGKGAFLERLLEKGMDVTGFDPAYEGDNPRIRRHLFEKGVGIVAGGLILRHVLEHIEDPYAFLCNLADANGGKGKIYIEVPCFDWICERRSWFDIFYEHVNYFRLSDFAGMFATVHESGRLFGGQYLYVVADLASLRTPRFDTARAVSFPTDFLASLTDDKTHVHEQAAVWGGASKGVIFSLLKQRTGQPVTTVIDINPAKQGKYLAGTGLRVQAPQEALASLPDNATIYVMNSNYLDEIKTMSKNAYHYVEVDHV